MNGQRVVKVFCHEKEAKRDFDKVNDFLFGQSNQAHRYANMLMPVLGNIGHVVYVIIAILGGVFILNGVSNVSIGMLFDEKLAMFGVALVVSFLQMSRQFSNNVNQVSQQVNSVVMGLAGASRVFTLIDEPSETDEGYVDLVNVKEVDGELVECAEHTGLWAWRHPHKADGSVTYTKLEGDVTMTEVDFGYTEDKIVLHDVSLYAKPGQKVAFVGATGAGKTTITNLLTRFYDIADGKIRYDGININKIKKSALRRSLGMVLQDTNLFTGTVMENIRYGNLDATDEECMEAARLACADEFIQRFPDGYDTHIEQGGSNVSGGQKQRLCIARALLKKPKILILDDSTSAVDTATDAKIRQAFKEEIPNTTKLIIAQRISSVQDADRIIVMEEGEVNGFGTHEELLENNAIYREVYESQTKGGGDFDEKGGEH